MFNLFVLLASGVFVIYILCRGFRILSVWGFRGFGRFIAAIRTVDTA